MTIEIELTGRVTDVDAYRALAEEMCNVAATEEGTLRYDWHVSPAGASRNIDVYRDGAAFLAHFGAGQENGTLPRFMEIVEVERVDVVGDVSAEAHEVLTQFGANFLDEVASIDA